MRFRPVLPSGGAARGPVCALAMGLAALASPSAAAPVVRTPAGWVAGREAGGIRVFEGIPFAAPPVGELRWRAPVAAAAWSDTLLATDYGPSCPQSEAPRHVDPASRGAGTDEACLTLNVWTRAGARADPVIVWIHGGGNRDGTAAQFFYDGAAFARDSIVFVSCDYRLGPLGFFAHPALSRESPAGQRADFGLLDQLAALRWVRATIGAFGGDTARVTVMGESSGGEDILALLASPAARGLFARAILESAGGGFGPPPSLAEAESAGVATARAAGVAAGAGAIALRALPAGALVRGVSAYDVGPVLDAPLLPLPPLEALADSDRWRVPVLIGTNDGEGSLLGDGARPDSLFPRLDRGTLARLREAYGDAATGDAAFARALFRDGYFAAPAHLAAREIARGARVYRYRFDYVAGALRARRANAWHGSEIPFVFETLRGRFVSDEDRAVAGDLHDCWVSFAREGVPSSARVPEWPAFGGHDGRMVVFGATPSVAPEDPAGVLDTLARALGPGR